MVRAKAFGGSVRTKVHRADEVRARGETGTGIRLSEADGETGIARVRSLQLLLSADFPHPHQVLEMRKQPCKE
jgi:hypothetical protein